MLLPLAAAFLALELVKRVYSSRGRDLNRCLALAGAMQWLAGILFAIGTRVP